MNNNGFTRSGAENRLTSIVNRVLGTMLLVVEAEELSLFQLDGSAEVPPWALRPSVSFCSTSRSRDKLSVVCPSAACADQPLARQAENGWAALRVDAPVDAAVLAQLSSVLAEADVPACAVRTLDTNHLLVRACSLNAVVRAMVSSEHVVRADAEARRTFGELLLPTCTVATGATGDLPALPDVFGGLWSRVIEEEPPGTVVDDTTLVWWLQAGDWYADIRIPRTSRVPVTAGGELPKLALAAQKSFAGTLEYQGVHEGAGQVTQWHRLADFHPPTGGADIGLNTLSEDGVTLVELGHPGADYSETWERIDGGTNFCVLQLAEPAGRFGLWLFRGTHWARVLGRPTDDACAVSSHVCHSLEHLMAFDAENRQKSVAGTAEPLNDLQQWLSTYEADFGIVEQPGSLHVAHSLRPEHEGRLYSTSLVAVDGAQWEERSGEALLSWRLVQTSGTDAIKQFLHSAHDRSHKA